MSIPRLTVTDFGGPDDGPLLLLGPSLGTTAATLWSGVAHHLARHARVVAWDLPGHGRGAPCESSFTVAELAAGVLVLADDVGADSFHYAGDSVGGCVGLQLGLDAPQRVMTATLLCTGSVIGTAASWHERAATVRSQGLNPILAGAAERWFGPGFTEHHPGVCAMLLDALGHVDPQSYARTCEALAEFDVTERLPEIVTSVLAVAGECDVPTPPEFLRRIASGVMQGRFVVLSGVGHLAPAEAPQEVATLVAEHIGLPLQTFTTTEDVYEAGMTVRREVLGDEHVDRAVAATTDLTADFQHMITQYAWGTIWTRPGLDRRSRSMITLTALIARGHHEELAMHLRAARRNGLSTDEIKEVLLQAAIYCGVPDANSAFRIATEVLSEFDTAAGTSA